ncbi:MAG: hypothetical protein U9O94_10635 [Nanoarchaeota archaeon]|nr:hypothetical protein [Nanoarchaeota archaeon]
MDPHNMIRAGIFFVAGFLMIFHTDKVWKFSAYWLDKIHVKY